MTDHTTYNVVIIGSGVSGAIAAYKLADVGRIVVLEAGETGPDRGELVAAFARAPVKTPGSPYLGRDGDVKAPGPETRADYYQHVTSGTPDVFKSTYLRRVGGSTWHFLGNVPRFLPNDFRLRSAYGVGVDWPVSYDDLEEDYCEAEELLGVAGDHTQWNGLFGARRSREFPMPAIWESYSDRRVTPAIEKVSIDGVPLRVLRTPQARNSRPYDGRPPCAGNSICVPLCPIQAKYDATVHVGKARARGVEIRDRAVVTRLELNTGGTQIAAVHYKDWNGSEHVVRGKVIVLAAHAIESAKVLLMSRTGSGLANSSDQVGRNLMDHPQGAGGCLAPEPLFPFRGPPTTSGIDSLRDGDFRRERAAFRMSLGNDGWGSRIESPLTTIRTFLTSGVFGTELRTRVEARLTYQFRISYSTEMLPDPENRITISTKLDDLGVPMPALRFQVPAYNHAAFEVARNVIRTIFLELGAPQESIKFFPEGIGFTGAGHILGTCRMAADSSAGVVDANGQSFDHPNLFILGSSVFPTSGTANPTLTAVALTLRAARRMRDVVRELR